MASDSESPISECNDCAQTTSISASQISSIGDCCLLPSENMTGSKVVADEVSNITRPRMRRLRNAAASGSLTRIFRIHRAQRQAQSPRTGAEKSGVINCNLTVRQHLRAKRLGVDCSALFGCILSQNKSIFGFSNPDHISGKQRECGLLYILTRDRHNWLNRVVRPIY